MEKRKTYIKSILILLLLGLLTGNLFAQDSTTTASTLDEAALTALSDTLQNNLNIVWTCVAAFLVFFMQAGFAMVESGFTRAKNTVNILMKNLMDFSIGSVVFFLVGFALMFGNTN